MRLGDTPGNLNFIEHCARVQFETNRLAIGAIHCVSLFRVASLNGRHVRARKAQT